VRRGWRIYPRRVNVRAGAPLTFPQVDKPSAALAKAVTDRVWPCVELQWEWLGGTTPVRRVAIVGAGSWGTSLAVSLARAGVEVELGCRTAEQVTALERKRRNERYLPEVTLPDAIRVLTAAELDVAAADVVCLAVPTRSLPAAMATVADRLGPRTTLVVLSKGLVPPAGELPVAFCSARAGGRPVACLGGPSHAADALEHGAALVVACTDREQTARLRAVFAQAGFDVETTSDVEGVDLAGVAKNAAVLAAATASVLGPNASGAAADLADRGEAKVPKVEIPGAKTFWNVASEKGLRVGVVNWWATWPADSVNGYVVTERALFKLEKGAPFEGETAPPEVFERLRALAGRASEKPRAIDEFALAAARLLRAPAPPDLEAVYLPGLDIATMQHVGDGGVADLAGLDARLDAVRAYYRLVDGLLGQAAEGLTPSDVLVLVGDPGRMARRAGAAEGLLALQGGTVRPGDLGAVSERDIAPTVLHLAGLPASRELEGHVLEDALSPAFRAAHPVRTVASYGRRSPGRPAESAFDRDMLEQLRSLGYVQ